MVVHRVMGSTISVLLQAGDISVLLLNEYGDFSIEIDRVLSGATVYPWTIKETTGVIESANIVLKSYEHYCRAGGG